MKNLILSGLVALLVAGSFVFFVPQGDGPAPGLGALSSPDLNSPYFSFGGFRKWALRSEMKTATTTVCAIQSPAATSTLVSAGVSFVTSSTSASVVTVAKSATAFATTTLLVREAVAANARADIMVPAFYSTLATSTLIFAPNQYVVVGMEGGVGTFSPTGTCQAEWNQLAY